MPVFYGIFFFFFLQCKVTMNKGSKMKGGWIEITGNEAMVIIYAQRQPTGSAKLDKLYTTQLLNVNQSVKIPNPECRKMRNR